MIFFAQNNFCLQRFIIGFNLNTYIAVTYQKVIIKLLKNYLTAERLHFLNIFTEFKNDCDSYVKTFSRTNLVLLE